MIFFRAASLGLCVTGLLLGTSVVALPMPVTDSDLINAHARRDVTTQSEAAVLYRRHKLDKAVTYSRAASHELVDAASMARTAGEPALRDHLLKEAETHAKNALSADKRGQSFLPVTQIEKNMRESSALSGVGHGIRKQEMLSAVTGTAKYISRNVTPGFSHSKR